MADTRAPRAPTAGATRLRPFRRWPIALRCFSGARRTAQGLEDHQSRMLRALVHHAYEQVPFYRRKFDEAGVHPQDLRTVNDLEHLPIVERAELQAESDDALCALNLRKKLSRVVRTSGSSGAPLVVRRSPAEDTLMLAFRARAVGAWGFGLRSRRTNIDHFNPEVLATEAQPKVYERLGVMPRLNLDWRTSRRETVSRAEAFTTDLVSGPPTLLAELADRLTNSDRGRIGARLVLTGAELMTEGMRTRITEGFGCPVADIFGCTETLFLAMETPNKEGYQVCEDAVIVEAVGGEQPHTGQACVTSLFQWGMPMIRYRLGDHITGRPSASSVAGSDPSLGKGATRLAWIDRIDGREIDRIRLKDGRTLHGYSLGELVESSGLPVQRFQIVQEERNRFKFRLVLTGGPHDTSPLHQSAQALLGDSAAIEVDVVETVERAGLKFIPVVSYERLRRSPTETDRVVPERATTR